MVLYVYIYMYLSIYINMCSDHIQMQNYFSTPSALKTPLSPPASKLDSVAESRNPCQFPFIPFHFYAVFTFRPATIKMQASNIRNRRLRILCWSFCSLNQNFTSPKRHVSTCSSFSNFIKWHLICRFEHVTFLTIIVIIKSSVVAMYGAFQRC